MAESKSQGVFDADEAGPAMSAFGRAIVSGQVLEVFLATLLGAHRRIHDREITREEWVAHTDWLEGQTLGRLKNLLKDLGASEPHIQQVEEALKLRNFLVHHSFREPERLGLMTTVEGRSSLEAEFQHASELFDECSKLTVALLLKVAVDAGYDFAHAIKRADSLAGREPRDVWERRVKEITSDPERRQEIERQLEVVSKLLRKA
jgi:hypothetical protein